MENSLLIPKHISDSLPSMVRNELSKLPSQKQDEFVEEYERNKKSVGIAYLLWLLLGWHYAYTGKWGLQVLYWILAFLIVWVIVDLFRIPQIIKDYNKDVAMNVMRNLKSIS